MVWDPVSVRKNSMTHFAFVRIAFIIPSSSATSKTYFPFRCPWQWYEKPRSYQACACLHRSMCKQRQSYLISNEYIIIDKNIGNNPCFPFLAILRIFIRFKAHWSGSFDCLCVRQQETPFIAIMKTGSRKRLVSSCVPCYTRKQKVCTSTWQWQIRQISWRLTKC